MSRKSFFVIVHIALNILCEVETEKITSNVLMLGGNGMLGSATAKSLLNLQSESLTFNITIVNRGNWYWDTEQIIKPFVNHFSCTRGDGFRDDCYQLANGMFYDTIIDFSAYDPLDIEDVIIVMRGRFGRYIYISSDSVYEVCLKKSHDGHSKEEDAIRPEDENTRHEYNNRDWYGHQKLQGEEVLEKFHKMLMYDYVALRLPDVLGPRDNTKRFWKYFMWAKLHTIVGPMHIPRQIQEKQWSFVYSLDVGRLVASLANPQLSKPDIFNQAYNLAFKDAMTLKTFFTSLGNFINKEALEFDETVDAHLSFGFPSVTVGPVDATKAANYLGWSPTDFIIAVNETCKFYEDAEYNKNYKFILDDVLDQLNVRGEKYRDFLELHYDRGVKSQKEEL